MTNTINATSGELSIEDVLAEGGRELPERALLRHRRGSRLSVSNVNSTSQVISNPQIALGNGGPVTQVGANSNSNTTNQSGTVLGF